jgi:hypothetical protein
MKTPRVRAIATLVLALAVGGCGSTYYRVTDPSTQRTYYTDEVKRSGTTVQFKDYKSGAEVTLPASEVLEISSDEFKKNTAKK